ncbi:MAG: DinB family protein [Polyangiaceae bacterium]|nr:DinB family protein [Myxococcales bacterium]MCB9588015.1 DinB family protein [Polyangiaceae bacterium]
METPRLFLAQACNNAWSNHRLLVACEKLSAEEFADASRTSFFPSISATLNHNLIVDWYYVDALEGGDLGLAAFASDVPCPNFADLAREQRAVDQRLIRFCTGLCPEDLSREVRMQRRDHVQVDCVARTLLHLLQHQIHHRGQAHAMLSGTSVKPPQLDEFFMAGEVHLRAEELAEIGLSEAQIWGC